MFHSSPRPPGQHKTPATRFVNRLAIASWLLASMPAHAGLNAGATATLTWSPTSVVSNLTPAGQSTRRLYIRYAGVTSVAGAEVVLLWAPGGSEDPAYTAVNFGAPAAMTCT